MSQKIVMLDSYYTIYFDSTNEKYWLLPKGQEECAIEVKYIGTLSWSKGAEPPIDLDTISGDHIVGGYDLAEDSNPERNFYSWYYWE